MTGKRVTIRSEIEIRLREGGGERGGGREYENMGSRVMTAKGSREVMEKRRRKKIENNECSTTKIDQEIQNKKESDRRQHSTVQLDLTSNCEDRGEDMSRIFLA